jgi:hypothetical protein
MNPRDKFDEEAERTLGMFANIKRVRANPYLADKVLRRIAEEREERPAFAPRTYRLAFAGLFVLIVVNVFSLVEIRSRAEAQQNVSNASSDPITNVALEYQMNANGYQY